MAAAEVAHMPSGDRAACRVTSGSSVTGQETTPPVDIPIM